METVDVEYVIIDLFPSQTIYSLCSSVIISQSPLFGEATAIRLQNWTFMALNIRQTAGKKVEVNQVMLIRIYAARSFW